MVYTAKTGNEEEDEAIASGEKKSTRGGTYLGWYTAGMRGMKGPDGDPNNAEGTFTYSNGDIYVGQWMSGKKYGKGSYSYAKNGTKLVGHWVNGKIVSGE